MSRLPLHQQAWADYMKQPVVEKSRNGVEMVLIPLGGVKMSQPWRLSKYEVTQAQFTRVMGWNPSYCQGENAKGADPKTLPVERIRWYVAVEFCNELSKLEKLKP
jgi:formylglycine-generating enzyme required for sulfatase activity